MLNVFWSRFLQCEFWKSKGVAPLYLTIKDHKPIKPGEFTKTRPVYASQSGMGVYLNILISYLLDPIEEKMKGVIETTSSEEMLHRIDRMNGEWENMGGYAKGANELGRLKWAINIVILGADAESLYPNLQKETSARVCAQEVLESEVEVTDLDWKEMGRYLFLNMSKEQHVEWDVQQWIPEKDKGGKESKLTMNSEQILGPNPPKADEWTFTEDKPSAFTL